MVHSAVNTEWNLTKYRIILQFSKDLGLNPALFKKHQVPQGPDQGL